MRLVRNLILFIIALYIGFVAFMPKSELYYFAESELKKQNVIVTNEAIEDKLLEFDILHANILYQGADIARVSKVTIKPLILFNRVLIDDVELNGMIKQYANIDIKTLKLNHTILKPFKVKIDATGSFGIASGYVDLKSRVVHIDLIEPENINSFKRYLKKGAKGWYYETKF